MIQQWDESGSGVLRVERARWVRRYRESGVGLQRCILHRKNSLHYRTSRGPQGGDLFMSLVETCRSNAVNPFDYMLAVVRNAARAKADPGAWMPWNFLSAIAEPAALSP